MRRLKRARVAHAASSLVVALLLAGCGAPAPRHASPASAGAHPPPANGSGSAQALIRAWADALRTGNVASAASYFGLPVIVENGTAPVRLVTRAQVRGFNASLPCGAKLLRTSAAAGYTIAVFQLTARPGGDCGSGSGQTAATAFRIRGGHFVEWRRVPTPTDNQAPPPGATPPGTTVPGARSV